MFYALAICVCLGVMFLIMACASLLGWSLRGMAAWVLRSWAPAGAARTLFTVRMLPLFLALSLSIGLALPAFFEFEPRSSGERVSAKLLLLSLAGGLMLVLMAIRAVRILRATARTERHWINGCRPYCVEIAGERLPLHLVDGQPGLLAVTGFFRPKLFVAKELARTLTWDELSAALAHEMAHVSFHDNLKQLLLKITRPPRWFGGDLDEAWTKVSEVAADEAAVAGGASALDLAAALVKTATLRRGYTSGEQMAASHLVPDGTGSAMEMRVARLEKVLQGESVGAPSQRGSKRWRLMGTIMVSVAVYLVAVSTLLPAIHEALELLVR